MNRKIIADLHNHTTASDGDFTPEEMVEQAKLKGLKAIGVTDHDTLKGLKSAVRAGDALGVEVVPGVEVSIRFKRPVFTGTLHLLCYFPAGRLADGAFVEDFGRVLSQGRGEKLVQARIEEINAVFGPRGTTPLLKREMAVTDISKLSDNATRRHFALALEKLLPTPDKETINAVIGNKSPAYLPSGTELDTVMAFAGKERLVSVLAHPAAGSFQGGGHYKEVLPPVEVVEQILPEFIQAGIRGLEVYYPGHEAEHVALMKSWAKTHDLLITGGSDCHDATQRPPGVSGMTETEFNLFKRALI